jgi:hypothetical protein
MRSLTPFTPPELLLEELELKLLEELEELDELESHKSQVSKPASMVSTVGSSDVEPTMR